MPTVKNFEDLDVWKRSRVLCRNLGSIIDQQRDSLNPRLRNQIEGSSGSIMDNIAEGFERGTRGEFIQFLAYAKGSCGECRSQIIRMFDRKKLQSNEYESLYTDTIVIGSMIQKLIMYLQKSDWDGVRKKRNNVKP
jgi:four helix bundle protein